MKNVNLGKGGTGLTKGASPTAVTKGGFAVFFDTSAFVAGVDGLIRDVDDATQRAVLYASVDVERIFRSLAVVLTGRYRGSWFREPVQQVGHGRWGASGGPGVVYARRLERRYGAVGRAYEIADVRTRLLQEAGAVVR